jgi:casein kinase II subunit alpha
MEPFFHGMDNPDQLVKIAKVMGTDDLYSYMEKFKITLDSHLYDGILSNFPRRIWAKFITFENSNIANAQALDLLDKMLIYDHTERITPKEALQHDYFQPVVVMWDRINHGESFDEYDEAYATAMAIQARKPLK